MSSPLHSPISTLSLSDTFATLYGRVNETITVVNQIKIYDLRARGGIVHSREVGVSGPVENIRLNLPVTGGTFGYGLNLITLSSSASGFVDGEAGTITDFEGMTQGVRVDFASLEPSTAFTENGGNAYVSANDLIALAATGSRGDGVWRLRSVSATNSLPYTIAGDHRFSGDIYFDGSKVVVNSSQFHLDDRLIFIASAGNTDDPSPTSGLTSNFGLAGGSGSGLVIKGASGDKFMVYFNSEGTGDYYAFRFSDHIQTDKSYISPTGQFNFVGTSGSAPSISLRTKAQDTATVQTGWKIFQSVTGAAAGSLQIRREGISDVNALELFSNGEVKVGTLSAGTGGQGSFRTYPAAFAVPAVGAGGVLHHGWQNRDVVSFGTTANGGLFAQPLSVYKLGTALVFNDKGQYIRGQWDADPYTGYKDAEVVGILEKTTSDYVLQIPVGGSGTAYRLNEAVRIQSWNGNFLSGYVWETPPANGLSGVKVIIDDFATTITAGTITGGSPPPAFYTSGATLYGSFDNAALGICGSIGITVTEQQWAVIVRNGVFDISQTNAATGYAALSGLTAGYVMYLHKDGGITYASGNNFNSEEFYTATSPATVAKPLFIYLGNYKGMYQPYQGSGITQAVTGFSAEPVFYEPSTQELTNFDILGDVGGRNKIINSGFDLWTRLDTMGRTYAGFEGSTYSGLTFGNTTYSVYPFGLTYDAGGIRASYIADGFFVDASGTNRNKQLLVQRKQINPHNNVLEDCSTPPENELVLTSKDTGSKKVRLYSVVPNYHTLGNHDFNFSFYAKCTGISAAGVTVGVAYVWASGVTHARIESYHLSLATGTGVSGGTAYYRNINETYTRYNFPFSSESLNLNTTGYKDSFVAPFIEFGSDMTSSEKSISTTGWQLSKGMSVKPYMKKPYAEEKGECDRYFQNVIVAHGGYFPLNTGISGPDLFTATNLAVPLAETPKVVSALDVLIRGICGGTTGDYQNLRKNYISVFRKTDPSSTTYHRYFETLYSLDASGFSGSVQSRLLGMA